MIKKQILEFVLKNWKVILIILLLIVVALKNSRDYRLMQTAYETQVESHKAQIEGLKEIHQTEMEEKQLLMESFLESIAAIEEDYEKALEELEDVKKQKRHEYEKKFRHDKVQLIKDIETKFGIEYVP